jgi:hypothetical protein
MKLTLLPNDFSVCRLPAFSPLPFWPFVGSVSSITHTQEEVSIVCESHTIPDEPVTIEMKVEAGWRCVKLEGPIPFEWTGILSNLIKPMAEAEISVFAFSTYDTDYVMVRDAKLADALGAWKKSGFTIAE